MMSKKWRRRWEAFGGNIFFLVGPPVILLLKLIPLSGVYLLGTVFAYVGAHFLREAKKDRASPTCAWSSANKRVKMRFKPSIKNVSRGPSPVFWSR